MVMYIYMLQYIYIHIYIYMYTWPYVYVYIYIYYYICTHCLFIYLLFIYLVVFLLPPCCWRGRGIRLVHSHVQSHSPCTEQCNVERNLSFLNSLLGLLNDSLADRRNNRVEDIFMRGRGHFVSNGIPFFIGAIHYGLSYVFIRFALKLHHRLCNPRHKPNDDLSPKIRAERK